MIIVSYSANFHSSREKMGFELTNVGHQVVQSTGRGRAYNENSPLLGDTANVAFLAATYAKAASGRFSKQASRYWCWARAQTRYMLGDGDRRFAIF